MNVTVTPTVAGITLAGTPDPLLTVPFNGAQVPTAFQAVIHNNGPTADTFRLSFANVPAGFTLLNGGTAVTIGAGRTGLVGLYLQPTGTLPAPGTPLSFAVTATSTTDPAVTKTAAVSFAMPAVDAVTVSASPDETATTPGTPATVTLTLENVGNVAEAVTLADASAAGLTAGGLAPVSLAVGETKTVTITLTPAADAALNDTLVSAVTGTFGGHTADAQLRVRVRSVEAAAIDAAGVAAGQGNNLPLAAVLTDLGDAVAQLQTTPSDAATLGRVQFLLGNLDTLLVADPALAPFVAQLQPIHASATAGDVSGLLAQVPTFFGGVTGVLVVEAKEQFSVSLTTTTIDVEPGQSKDLAVKLVNTGNDPVTLTLSAPGLPAQVTADFSHAQVVLPAGATATETVALGNTLVSSKLFRLNVTAATLVQHTTTSVVAVRSATADVLSVTVNPSNPAVGGTVTASAQVFNTANAARDALAHLDILDAGNNVVGTPPEVSFHLAPGAGSLTLDLGQVAIGGLPTGVYSLRVSLRAGNDTPLPGHAAQALLGVGQLVTASVAASSTVVPPGTPTVTTTITVANNFGSGSAASGLVALYEADGTAADAVGQNTGTLVGGAGYGPGASGVPGDQAFTFDGSGNQFVSTANTPSLDFGASDFTIDLRVKFNDLTPPPENGWPGGYELFHKVTGLVPDDQTYFLEWDAPNALRFMVRDGEANQNDLMIPTSLVAGKWYHVTAIRQGDTSSIYLDGVLIGTQTAGVSVDTGGRDCPHRPNRSVRGDWEPRPSPGRLSRRSCA